MKRGEHYEADVLFFFDGHPLKLRLYQLLFRRLDELFPEGIVKVQKSQISFYGRHLFATASLPVRRKKDWPEHCLLVTFGLGEGMEDPRIAVAVEPYPNRWTHHVVISSPEQVDSQLLGWLKDAWLFSEQK